MPVWSWRTSPDESVHVLKPGATGYVAPTSSLGVGVDKAQQNVLQWLPLAEKYSAKYGVPVSWILGVIYAESGGNPKAENYCCVGLMAIAYRVHGKTREAMLDPEQNMDYGTSLLAHSRKSGHDLPAAASIHVAGGGITNTPHAGTCCSAKCKPSCRLDKNGNPICAEHPEHPEGSPWGMCEHMFTKTHGDGAVGYIDRVVRANNSFIQLLGGKLPVEPGTVPGQPSSPAAARPSPAAIPAALGVFAGFAAVALARQKGWL